MKNCFKNHVLTVCKGVSKLHVITWINCSGYICILLVSRSHTTFFLLYSDGKKGSGTPSIEKAVLAPTLFSSRPNIKEKKWSGYARLVSILRNWAITFDKLVFHVANVCRNMHVLYHRLYSLTQDWKRCPRFLWCGQSGRRSALYYFLDYFSPFFEFSWIGKLYESRYAL